MKRGDTLKITKTFNDKPVTLSYLVLAVKENTITVRTPKRYIARININNFTLVSTPH